MYRFMLFALFFLIFSCDNRSTEKQKTTEDSLTTVHTDSTVQSEENAVEIPESAPEWYRDIPEKEGFLYVAANARSARADIAEEKAVYIARIQMAEKVKNLKAKSRRNKGGVQAADDKEIEMQDLNYSIVIKKKRIKENGYWRAFVLLEMKAE